MMQTHLLLLLLITLVPIIVQEINILLIAIEPLRQLQLVLAKIYGKEYMQTDQLRIRHILTSPIQKLTTLI